MEDTISCAGRLLLTVRTGHRNDERCANDPNDARSPNDRQLNLKSFISLTFFLKNSLNSGPGFRQRKTEVPYSRARGFVMQPMESTLSNIGNISSPRSPLI